MSMLREPNKYHLEHSGGLGGNSHQAWGDLHKEIREGASRASTRVLQGLTVDEVPELAKQGGYPLKIPYETEPGTFRFEKENWKALHCEDTPAGCQVTFPPDTWSLTGEPKVLIHDRLVISPGEVSVSWAEPVRELARVLGVDDLPETVELTLSDAIIRTIVLTSANHVYEGYDFIGHPQFFLQREVDMDLLKAGHHLFR